jgi:lysophospholipase L1-like esterase
MFAYGTNETVGTQFFAATYEADLRAVLQRLRRAAPDVSCVLISPFDISAPREERRGPHAALVKAIEIQRRVSQGFGCGFWDGYAFMGGAGSIVRWAMARPPLAQADHIHLTPLGYVYMGVALGDALLRAYDVNPGRQARSAAAVR